MFDWVLFTGLVETVARKATRAKIASVCSPVGGSGGHVDHMQGRVNQIEASPFEISTTQVYFVQIRARQITVF